MALNTYSLQRRLLTLATVACAAATLLAGPAAQAQDKAIVMASTTSTEQSGLFGHLLPQFRQATGIDIKVLALNFIGDGLNDALNPRRRR